jgi:hypothetical protein
LACLVSVCLATSCAPHITGKLAKPPSLSDRTQRCGAEAGEAKPLVVEWSSADRGQIEAGQRRGLMVVRYDACNMHLLTHCKVADVDYEYHAFTPKRDKVVMKDADDLYANIPMGAARFAGKLATSGELGVNMTMVGSYQLERGVIKTSELGGMCDGATHVISSLTVGAFEFFAKGKAEAGASATVGSVGAGAKASSKRETLSRDGEPKKCKSASDEDQYPPKGCSALLRLSVRAARRRSVAGWTVTST